MREPAIGLFIYRGVENTFKRLIEYAIAKPAPALAKCPRQRSYSNSPVQGPAMGCTIRSEHPQNIRDDTVTQIRRFWALCASHRTVSLRGCSYHGTIKMVR